MKEYTNKTDWDRYFYDYKPRIIDNVIFSDIFNKYLTRDNSKSVLEVGCAGGDFLCYLAKTFQYQAFGVDYSDEIKKTKELFAFNGLVEPTLYKEDFFKWDPGIKFDVVCSFGFIEHFDKINEVVSKHADLLFPNGKLIITLPRFSSLQYFFHWLIDRENLKKHNTKIMNLGSIRKAVEISGCKIEYLSYYKTFGFWTERTRLAPWEKCINWSILKFGKVINKVFGYNRPNFLFSPHLVCVATKNK